MPTGFGLTFSWLARGSFFIVLHHSIIRGSDPTIKDSPTFSVLIRGIAGPHLGPRQPCWAYQLLPHDKGGFCQGISLLPLHIDLEANLRISAHRPIMAMPHPTAPMLQPVKFHFCPEEGGDSDE